MGSEWPTLRSVPTGREGELSHKEFVPWELTKEDSWDMIARGLRSWSMVAQGHDLTSSSQRTCLRRLRIHLEKYDRVVAYDRRQALLTGIGWKLVPRDPAIDDPDMPIRRPS